MDLKQLQAVGGLVDETDYLPVTKDWETPDGETVSIDFFVRRQSFASVEKFWQEQENAGKTGRSANAMLIASCVRLGKNGEQELTYKDACRLNPSLALVFINGINEALAPKKKPAGKKTSGTSSSSPASVEKQSKKPSAE